MITIIIIIIMIMIMIMIIIIIIIIIIKKGYNHTVSLSIWNYYKNDDTFESKFTRHVSVIQ